MNAFSERIRRLIADELDIDFEDVQSESDFVRDLGADSMDLVQLAMELEIEFDIDIPDAEFAALTTVSDATEYLMRKTGYTERADT